MIASFITNLIISTFFFSSIIATKGSFHKYGFVISFIGTSAGAIFSLLIPLLPESIPWTDVCIGLVVAIWLPLTKRYTQMSWLGSFAAAAFGALFYTLVSALVTAFVAGLLTIFPRALSL